MRERTQRRRAGGDLPGPASSPLQNTTTPSTPLPDPAPEGAASVAVHAPPTKLASLLRHNAVAPLSPGVGVSGPLTGAFGGSVPSTPLSSVGSSDVLSASLSSAGSWLARPMTGGGAMRITDTHRVEAGIARGNSNLAEHMKTIAEKMRRQAD